MSFPPIGPVVRTELQPNLSVARGPDRASALAPTPKEAPGERLAKGAVSLSQYATNWSGAGGRALMSDGPTQWSFNDWTSKDASIRFPSLQRQLSINCRGWVGLAGLKAGVVDRATLYAWLKRVDQSITKDTAQQERALISGPIRHLKLEFTPGPRGRRDVRLAADSPLPKTGQLISIDGLDHVLLVIGVQGRQVKIASFPRIPFGDIISGNGLSKVKPYAGTLEGWLKENYNYYEDPKETNLQTKPFAFGTPSFLR